MKTLSTFALLLLLKINEALEEIENNFEEDELQYDELLEFDLIYFCESDDVYFLTEKGKKVVEKMQNILN